MLAAIAPAWTLTDATAMDPGYHPVYRLSVETPDDPGECYLKATPAGAHPSVRLGARLQAIIETTTSIPTPEVFGLVDGAEDLPAPFFLMAAMPGEALFRTNLPSIDDETLSTVARDTGRYLAELHTVDIVDGYGYLTHAGPPLSGEPPSGEPDTVVVEDPTDNWPEQVRRWADQEFDIVADTRLAETATEARPVLDERIEDLEGPFEPVLARIDQSLDNVLVGEDGLSAFLDWEFTIAATAGYDLVHVTKSLAGGPYRYSPAVRDRRPVVREAVLKGYGEQAGSERVEQARWNWDCYALLSAIRSMGLFENWFRTFDLGEEVDDAATAVREEVRALL